jgi:hypothetical protein
MISDGMEGVMPFVHGAMIQVLKQSIKKGSKHSGQKEKYTYHHKSLVVLVVKCVLLYSLFVITSGYLENNMKTLVLKVPK